MSDYCKAPQNLRPGDWIRWQYGFEEYDWYVLANFGGKVKLGKPSWLVSSAMYVSHRELQERGYAFIANTPWRWWWRYLPFRDCICPLSKPRNLWWI